MIWPALLAVVYPVLFDGSQREHYTEVPAPGVQYRRSVAAATSAPWVDSNLWRYKRRPQLRYLVNVRGKSLPLAMAEAFACNVSLAVEADAAQRSDYERMLAFLKNIPHGPLKPWVNLAVTDDGSAPAAEALNLLSRRNLLYRIAEAWDPRSAWNFQLTAQIENPYALVQQIRQQIGDERRLLRLYGSELVLAELAREHARVRLHLIHYGSRPVESLRVRLQGRYRPGNIRAFIFENQFPRLNDFTYEAGFTEFSIDRLPVYAVLDLR